MASLEARFKDKLFVTKVLQEDMFDRDVDLARFDNVLGGLSAYEPNRIAVVCGNTQMIEKFSAFLSTVGYPGEAILTIPVAE